MQHQHSEQNIVACFDLLSQSSLSIKESLLSEDLCRSISNRNGELSPEEVKVSLLNGRSVYTFSKRYHIA